MSTVTAFTIDVASGAWRPRHYVLLCPPLPGHLNPALALAGELLSRGHRVTALTTEDFAEAVRARGVDLALVGRERHPAGSLRALNQALAQAQGTAGVLVWHRDHARYTETLLDEAPALLKRLRPDVLLVDEVEIAGQTLAEHLGLPFAVLCNALPHHRDPRHAPIFAFGRPSRNPLRRGWRAFWHLLGDRLVRPTFAAHKARRRAWGLPELRGERQNFARSSWCTLAQLPAALDLPRAKPPAGFVHTRAWRSPPPRDVSREAWPRNGLPVVYASLGSLQGGRKSLFALIAEACHGLPLQLVIAHGGALSDAETASLPGAPTCLRWAPQEAILDEAALTITHCGLNTALDSLERGVPCVGIPLTFEQPAIAERIVWHGLGRFFRPARLTAPKLRTAVQQALGDDALAKRARSWARALPAAPGVKLAADALLAARPVSPR